jgi:hypothetical protein
MPYNYKPTYEQLLVHAEHHDIKRMLMDMFKKDGAHTLHDAVKRQRPHRLARKIAEMLAK